MNKILFFIFYLFCFFFFVFETENIKVVTCIRCIVDTKYILRIDRSFTCCAEQMLGCLLALACSYSLHSWLCCRWLLSRANQPTSQPAKASPFAVYSSRSLLPLSIFTHPQSPFIQV